MKAERTRRHIADVAVTAFIEQGYDETTMEQIAETALISISTLYRYFPSKEHLLLDPFSQVLDYARYLRARPASEPADVAMASALLDMADDFADPERRIPEIRRIIDVTAVPRARLWDYSLNSRADFEAALAERMDLEPTDNRVRIAVGVALDVFHRVDDQWKADNSKDYRLLFREALESLQETPITLPRLPASERSDLPLRA
jgi:AcrR family transcriptional regulator